MTLVFLAYEQINLVYLLDYLAQFFCFAINILQKSPSMIVDLPIPFFHFFSIRNCL